MTKVIDKNQINLLKEALNEKEVVAFPTDTVFGIACICDEEAIQKMKWVKGRDEKKPFPMMVYDIHQINEIAEITDVAVPVIQNFMPGALTIILKKKKTVPDLVTNGQATIAIRIPDDETVLNILKDTGPLLVTSANLSNHPAACNTQEVLDQLDGRISYVLKGESKGGAASTLVDCTTNELKILREGPISLAMLQSGKAEI